MCSYFETYQPIRVSGNPPDGQVLILPDHSLEACKEDAARILRCRNWADDPARYNSFEAESMGGPGSFTGSNATV
jgi:hypothetical protein